VHGNQVHIVSPCIDALCDGVHILDNGKIRLDGNVEVRFAKGHFPTAVQASQITISMGDGTFAVSELPVPARNALIRQASHTESRWGTALLMLTPAGQKYPRERSDRTIESAPLPMAVPARGRE
jgi:hypothetical protein